MGQIVATAGIKIGAVVVSEPSSLLSEFAAQLGKHKKKKGLDVAGEAVVPPPPILVDEKPLALHLGIKTVNKLQAQGEVHGQKNGTSRARVDHPLRSLVRESGSQAIADGMSVLNSQQLKTGKSRERSSSDSLVSEGNKAAARPSDISAPFLPLQAVADVASMQALNDQPLKTGKPGVRSVSDSLLGESNKIGASTSEVSDGVFRASTESAISKVISHPLAAVDPEGAMIAEQGAPLRSAKVATPDTGEDHLLSEQEQMLAASFAKGEGSFVSRAPAKEAHIANLRAKSEDVPSQGTSDVAVADQQPDGQMLYRFNRWGGGHSVSIQAQSQEGNLQLELQASNAFVQDRLHHHLQQIDSTERWTLLGDSEQQKDQQQGQDPQDEENE
jgi:hypothetical protein